MFGLPGKAAAVNFPGSYAENFDSMATGTTAPAGWSFYGNLGGSNTTWASSIPTADAGLGTVNATLVVASPSGVSSNTAGYNFPAGTAPSRALGSSPTSGRGGLLQLSLTNTSGVAVNGLTLGYDIHRFTAPATANELPGYRLFYSLNSGSTWTSVSALDPALSGATVNVPNTTGVTSVTGAGVSLSAPWAASATLLLRWVDDNAEQTAPDQILGLDNVSIATAAGSAVSFPGTYAQTFDTMGTGTAASAGWTFYGNLGGSNTTWATSIPVADAGLGAANATLIVASPSAVSSNTAGYNFQAFTVGNRCLGSSPASGSGGVWQLSLTNTSGSAVSALDMSYAIHRFTVATTANELPGFRVFYSLNGGGTWVNATALNPTISGGSVTVPNTTGTTTVAGIDVELSAPWASGTNLLLRWIDDNAVESSPDQILGLDNVSIAAVAPNLPPVVTLSTPANATTGAGSPLTLQAAISDPESAPLTVTFYGRKKTGAAGADFTLMTLPDTQFYSENVNNRFSQFLSQTNWIVSSKTSLNTAFVAHMGDMVQNGDSLDAEWLRADQAMDIIEDPITTALTHGIPWGGAPGNHDGGGPTYLKWNQYFGAARWAGRPYYQGNYGGNNGNNYQFFSASGLDFIVINLAYNPNTGGTQAIMDWADALLKANPARRAIITSHWLINTGNPATWGGHGQTLYDNLKDNPNLFLMLCGHVHGEGQRQDVFEGRTVYTILQDYQDRTGSPGGLGGGDGWLRYYVFSPASNTFSAKTYRTTASTFETDADSQFTLPYSMNAGPWVQLDTVNVAGGVSSASTVWSGLEAATEYEWYAAVSDGSKSASSSVFSFTTASTPSIGVDDSTVDPGFGATGNAASGTFSNNGSSLSFTATRGGVAFGTVTWNAVAGTWSWSKAGLTPADNGTVTIQISNGVATASVNFTLTVAAAQFSPIPDLALNTLSAGYSRLLRIANLGPTGDPSTSAKVYWGGSLQSTVTLSAPFGYHDLTLAVPAVPGGQPLPWTTEVAVEALNTRRTFNVTIFSNYSVGSTVHLSGSPTGYILPEAISDNGDVTGDAYTTAFTTDGYPSSEVPWFGAGQVFSTAIVLPRILPSMEWYGYGNGINNNGAIVGSGYSHVDLTDEDKRPLFWANSASTPLALETTGTGSANDINENNEIVGVWEPAGGRQATCWIVSGGSASRITLPGAGTWSDAESINDVGTIVGVKNFWTSIPDTCVWEKNGSGGFNAPIVLNPPSGGNRGTRAMITDSGMVYSVYGYRWKKQGQTWNPVPEALPYGYASVNYHGLAVAGATPRIYDTGIIGGPIIWDFTPTFGSDYWARCINNRGQVGIYIYASGGATVLTPVTGP